jgi:hypothetical protein
LQVFPAVDAALRYRPQMKRYRPPSCKPTAQEYVVLRVFLFRAGNRGRCGR